MTGRVEVSRLTGAACVARLRDLGFEIVRRSNGIIVLARGDRRVAVPDVAHIDETMLDAILRSADVALAELFGIGRRSGAYARVVIDEPTRARDDEA